MYSYKRRSSDIIKATRRPLLLRWDELLLRRSVFFLNRRIELGSYHYDAVVKNVNAYYLEFDDARSGGFEPLASVSGEKKVVLGLVTTKRPELENKDAVIARIHEAAKYLPLDRLCLSPQCGFASCEIGNKLTEAQQWAKLALVKEIAEEVWG